MVFCAGGATGSALMQTQLSNVLTLQAALESKHTATTDAMAALQREITALKETAAQIAASGA